MTQIHLSRPARHVALITIDNPPKLNAMTRPMLVELGRLWDGAGRQPLHRRHR
jgi:enoyl-CoA hydratase/carnithine racemase